jgi:hypothetical protein
MISTNQGIFCYPVGGNQISAACFSEQLPALVHLFANVLVVNLEQARHQLRTQGR